MPIFLLDKLRKRAHLEGLDVDGKVIMIRA
jgi:hypothetical protein